MGSVFFSQTPALYQCEANTMTDTTTVSDANQKSTLQLMPLSMSAFLDMLWSTSGLPTLGPSVSGVWARAKVDTGLHGNAPADFQSVLHDILEPQYPRQLGRDGDGRNSARTKSFHP